MPPEFENFFLTPYFQTNVPLRQHSAMRDGSRLEVVTTSHHPQQDLGGKQQNHHEPEKSHFVMVVKPAVEASAQEFQPGAPNMTFAFETVVCLLHG